MAAVGDTDNSLHVSLQQRRAIGEGGQDEEEAISIEEENEEASGNALKDLLDPPWADSPVFLLDLFFVLFLGVVMGLLSKPYSWIADEPELSWFTKTGPDKFLKDPATMQFCSGAPIWIPLCAAGGLAVGILKVMVGLDAYPSFITELKHMHVDPRVSWKVLVCCIASLATGATLGLEAGLGATGSALGYLTYIFMCKAFPGINADREQSELRRKMLVLCGIAAAFGSILPAPYVAAILVGEVSSAGTEQQAQPGEFLTARRLPRKVVVYLVPASTAAFVVRRALDDAFDHPSEVNRNPLPVYHNSAAVWALFLGVLAALVGLIFLLAQAVSKVLMTKLGVFVERRIGRAARQILLCAIAGAVTGLGMYMFPLVFSSGRSMMGTTMKNRDHLSVGLLTGTAIAKCFTFSLGMSGGLVGGMFFPLMYVGLVSGEVVGKLGIDGLDPAWVDPVMMGAVPASFLTAPLTMLALPVSMFTMGPLHSIAVFVGIVTSSTILVGTGFLHKLLKS
mmetsp:Transcript_43779/g.93721  ORF Transcript_43779/g.93721 Transcript_43779/m.93721 type:complete len:508 (+) Transcript_43779:125-1648(+)|eukprot:CAMPEP_0206461756 /NCGR_PEP_ID=MMETSP0324_2-20121206/25559_1 /ASSEMBLY_ACC=CAM_ASM_000836 /TAXON_ID=2866 /ORGANISM="Crypthecodinium cohnii, Strain Seligo" /LENGTH=507 /DNA_ID=CAMNT_0053933755 /DNA_START=125 /DNA_END=1648 /DNA_ORIENTATION=+